MTEFKVGRAGDGQDVGNNLLLQQVNAGAREAAACKRAEELRDKLNKYLESKAVESPVGETVIKKFSLFDLYVFVFEDFRYFAISIERDYESIGSICSGVSISIEDGVRCGIMLPVMDILNEYREWEKAAIERREENHLAGSLRRLRDKYSTEKLKQLLGLDNA